jgi:hypothetical protein
MEKFQPVVRSQGSNVYQNVAPGNVSIRDGFSRSDYETYRPEEANPRYIRGIIRDCMRAYDQHPIIRNIIDLMGDFATQGIDLYHPVESVQRWYKEWFRRIRGKERSERFLNLLYLCGNVIPQRKTARIPVRLERQMKQVNAADIEVEKEQIVKREIPWEYVYHNPLSLEIDNEDIVTFFGSKVLRFGIKVPPQIASKLRSKQLDKSLLELIPPDVLKLLRANKNIIPLPPDKTFSFYYKKNDWQVWATPMLRPLLPDLNMLEKMKLADLAALDGAISCIRVWKLGSLEHKILPSEAAISRLAEMLMNNVGGGVMDLVWGPEIDLLETSTEVYRFLGETKYAPILNSIFQGLGIPPSLAGSGNTVGFTNNFISLKTLTERLQYGRDILREFWEQEIRYTQKAMGFAKPAVLCFDRMVLTDEAAEKKLLMDMADRDLISWETLVERFGETPEIESARLRREQRKREKKQLPPKASPWHDPQKEYNFKKLFVQSGTLTPSEVGIELEERKKGEKSLVEHQAEQKKAQQDSKLRGQPGQGRPRLSTDKTKRKTKTVKPRTSVRAELITNMVWAEQAQSRLSTYLTPIYLKMLGRKTGRELTESQAATFEDFKFRVFCQANLHEELTDQRIDELTTTSLALPEFVEKLQRKLLADHVNQHGREPTLEIRRRYQAGVFALWKGSYEGIDSPDGVPSLPRAESGSGTA